MPLNELCIILMEIFIAVYSIRIIVRDAIFDDLQASFGIIAYKIKRAIVIIAKDDLTCEIMKDLVAFFLKSHEGFDDALILGMGGIERLLRPYR